MFLIIYLLGVILAFVLYRHYFRMHTSVAYYGWSESRDVLLAALLSWIAILIMTVIHTTEPWCTKLDRKKSKPPRWL